MNFLSNCNVCFDSAKWPLQFDGKTPIHFLRKKSWNLRRLLFFQGFTLHFYFAPNDYFTNSVLTKEYEMKCEPSEDDPFSFEGPEIFKCKGSTINWKEGKNLTVKTVKKKQKHKSKGNVRTITKQVKNDSFFNFFDPPPIPDDPDADVDPETQDLLTADFEIGHYIRDRIIPRAVLFFTGN